MLSLHEAGYSLLDRLAYFMFSEVGFVKNPHGVFFGILKLRVEEGKGQSKKMNRRNR
jgi:hypothetical protein